MKVYGIFHGGCNYSQNITNRSVEEFSSIKQARDIFESRADFDPYYPCVDESAEMQLFFSDPRNDEDETDDESLIDPGYPDRVLSLGPRGGVHISRC